MTAEEVHGLQRRVERLQTEVYLLGSIVGTLLSIIGQLGYQQIEDAIISGLTDAAASVPARNESDWDAFMTYIRKQGAATKVTRTAGASVGKSSAAKPENSLGSPWRAEEQPKE